MDPNKKCNGFTKEAKLYDNTQAEECSLYAGFYSDKEFWCCDLYDAFDGYVSRVGNSSIAAECCYASQEPVFSNLELECEAGCPPCYTCVNGSCQQIEGCSLDGNGNPTLTAPPPVAPTPPLPDQEPECINDSNCPNCTSCTDGLCIGSRCNNCESCVENTCVPNCTSCDRCDPSNGCVDHCQEKDGCLRCTYKDGEFSCQPYWPEEYPEGCYECMDGVYVPNISEDERFNNCLSCAQNEGGSGYEWRYISDGCSICVDGEEVDRCTNQNVCYQCSIDDQRGPKCRPAYSENCYSKCVPENGRLRLTRRFDTTKCESCECPPEKPNCEEREKVIVRPDLTKCTRCVDFGDFLWHDYRLVGPDPKKCEECVKGPYGYYIVHKCEEGCYECDGNGRCSIPTVGKDKQQADCLVCENNEWVKPVLKQCQLCNPNTGIPEFVYYNNEGNRISECPEGSSITVRGNGTCSCSQCRSCDTRKCQKCIDTEEGPRCLYACNNPCDQCVLKRDDEGTVKYQCVPWEEFVSDSTNQDLYDDPSFTRCLAIRKEFPEEYGDLDCKGRFPKVKRFCPFCQAPVCIDGEIKCVEQSSSDAFGTDQCLFCEKGEAKIKYCEKECEVCKSAKGCVPMGETTSDPCTVWVNVNKSKPGELLQKCKKTNFCENDYKGSVHPSLNGWEKFVECVDNDGKPECVGPPCGNGRCPVGYECCDGKCKVYTNQTAFCKLTNERYERINLGICENHKYCKEKGGQICWDNKGLPNSCFKNEEDIKLPEDEPSQPPATEGTTGSDTESASVDQVQTGGTSPGDFTEDINGIPNESPTGGTEVSTNTGSTVFASISIPRNSNVSSNTSPEYFVLGGLGSGPPPVTDIPVILGGLGGFGGVMPTAPITNVPIAMSSQLETTYPGTTAGQLPVSDFPFPPTDGGELSTSPNSSEGTIPVTDFPASVGGEYNTGQYSNTSPNAIAGTVPVTNIPIADGGDYTTRQSSNTSPGTAGGVLPVTDFPVGDGGEYSNTDPGYGGAYTSSETTDEVYTSSEITGGVYTSDSVISGPPSAGVYTSSEITGGVYTSDPVISGPTSAGETIGGVYTSYGTAESSIGTDSIISTETVVDTNTTNTSDNTGVLPIGDYPVISGGQQTSNTTTTDSLPETDPSATGGVVTTETSTSDTTTATTNIQQTTTQAPISSNIVTTQPEQVTNITTEPPIGTSTEETPIDKIKCPTESSFTWRA